MKTRDLTIILFLSMAVLFLCQTGLASPLFYARFDFEAGVYPHSVAIGDLNGDGAVDVVVANYGMYGSYDDAVANNGSYDDVSGMPLGNDTVSVLLGNGDGTFQSAVNYEVGDSPESVAIGDLNGDGALDLAVANFGSGGNVSVLLGNGDGTFQSAVNYGAGEWPRSVAIGDLNGDGDLDLAVANQGPFGSVSNVSVLLGNGDGTFQSAVNYEAGYALISVAIGDLNGDGDLDLAVANSGIGGNVSVLLGNGDGTFQSAVHYEAGVMPIWVAMGDLDGDDDLDLAVANTYSNNVSVLLGNGDGTFQSAVHYEAGDSPQSVTIGDLDGNGTLDLAVANFRMFYPMANYDEPMAYYGSYDDAVANNGSYDYPPGPGYDDVSGTVSVLLGNGDGTFQSAIDYGAGDMPNSVAIGDLDGDGDMDLAVANGANKVSVLLLLGYGDGIFQSAVNYEAGDNPQSVAIGDLDGDGDLDLAVANVGIYDYETGTVLSNGTVSVLLGNGDGTFQSAVDYEAGEGPFAAAIDDLDGDGDLDLAATNRGSLDVSGMPLGNGTVSVLLGNGDGTFQSAVNYEAGDGPGPLAIGDLDADDALDLVVANAGSNNVSVLLGNGDGTFQSTVHHEAGDRPGGPLTIGDLDGDGDLDLAVANAGSFDSVSNTVSVLLNNGDGTFQSAVDYEVGLGPIQVAIDDLDGDGDLDLAVANAGSFDSGSNTVSVLLSNGDGTFQSAVDYEAGLGPQSVAIGDLDGNGVLDLAVANGGLYGELYGIGGTLSVLLGNGDGTFQSAVHYGAGDMPARVAIGDLNGDGALDLAVANGGWPGNVSVLINLNNTYAGGIEVDAGNGVTVTFDEVTAPGNTTAIKTEEGPPPPTGFKLAGAYYEITTTATYDGPITICLVYDLPTQQESKFEEPEVPVIKQFDDATNTWEPIQDIVLWDKSENKVCFITEHLPLLGLMYPVYQFSGFLPPVSLGKLCKLGRTVPVKFQLTDAMGNYITTAVATLTLQQYVGEEPVGDPIVPTSPGAAHTGNIFRYNLESNRYIYNLSTKGLQRGTYLMIVALDDGEEHTTFISFR